MRRNIRGIFPSYNSDILVPERSCLSLVQINIIYSLVLFTLVLYNCLRLETFIIICSAMIYHSIFITE